MDVMHFTRVEHVGAMIEHGMVADNEVAGSGLLQIEVGNQSIKARRRVREVPLPPGGVVADYVPFYFAPRSPMMYSIHRGNVTTYDDGCERLVYVVTEVERLLDLQLPTILTDRNAVLQIADFAYPSADLPEDFVNWPLMSERFWNNTPDQPDRMERRMAECLVHQWVPWIAVTEVVTQTERVAREVSAVLSAARQRTSVVVRPGWYF